MKRLLILGVLSLFFFTNEVYCQTYDKLYAKALQFKSEYRYIESLATFQILLKSDSNNVNYLTNTSLLLSKVGNTQPDEAQKPEYFRKAEYIAIKAITRDSNNADAHYTYALALGRLNENASSKQKIANAKLIRNEAEKAILLNPEYAAAYHILGRWHRTIAGFNFMERLTINTLFGGMPVGGTYEDAIINFKKAIKYEPQYILHYYELALTYLQRNAGPQDKVDAKLNLEKATNLLTITPEDVETVKKCKALLEKPDMNKAH